MSVRFYFLIMLSFTLLVSCKSDKAEKEVAPKEDTQKLTYENSYKVIWEITEKGIGPIKTDMSIELIPKEMITQVGNGSLRKYKILDKKGKWVCDIVADESDGLIDGIFVHNELAKTKGGVGVGSSYADFRKEFDSFTAFGDWITQHATLKVGNLFLETDFHWEENIIMKSMIPEDAKFKRIWIVD